MSSTTPVGAEAPKIGDPFPAIRLPDQSGRAVDLHAARGARKALVVFYRSARW